MERENITIEIFEGKGGNLKIIDGEIVYPDLAKEGICAWMYRGDGEKSYQQGKIFNYPEDLAKLCPWLLDSMKGFIRVLQYDGKLGWRYAGTPYEKEINNDGVTTEFVRCSDPTASGIVVKITKYHK